MHAFLWLLVFVFGLLGSMFWSNILQSDEDLERRDRVFTARELRRFFSVLFVLSVSLMADCVYFATR